MYGTGRTVPSGAHLGVFARVVDAHDRRVRHAGGRLRLETEPGAERVVVREVAIEELDRDLTTQGEVVAAEDGGHAAAPDQFVDAVAPRKHARLSCHGHSLGGTTLSLTDRTDDTCRDRTAPTHYGVGVGVGAGADAGAWIDEVASPDGPDSR